MSRGRDGDQATLDLGKQEKKVGECFRIGTGKFPSSRFLQRTSWRLQVSRKIVEAGAPASPGPSLYARPQSWNQISKAKILANLESFYTAQIIVQFRFNPEPVRTG